MPDPINLNKARKARARADKEKRAAENRVKFGRAKADKALNTANSKKAADRFDAHLRGEKPGGD